MADDLDDEWWKGTASDDDVGDSAGEDQDVREAKPAKRSVKRPAGSEEDDQGSSEPDLQAPPPCKKSKAADSSHSQSQPKPGKKKKKKSQKKFTRKKITEVDEAVLKKGGTPEDVQALLKPLVAVSKSDVSQPQSDDDDDDDDEEEEQLSLDDDFFATKQDPDESAGSYLGREVPGWQVAVNKARLDPGTPLMLVICSSAIRAVQLNRELKSFLGKDCKTAKLFAKHMKLEEQKSFLKKKVCHASIGTPNRIQALLESGCLKLSQLHAVVLDWNWRDVKLKRMVDIPDVRRDLTVLLKDHALEHIRQTPCRIAVL